MIELKKLYHEKFYNKMNYYSLKDIFNALLKNTKKLFLIDFKLFKTYEYQAFFKIKLQEMPPSLIKIII